MSLPPSQFGNEGDYEDYVREEYDPEIWDSPQEAVDAYNALDDKWGGGSGYKPIDIWDNIVDIWDVHRDQYGNLHFTYLVDMPGDSPVQGVRHV